MPILIFLCHKVKIANWTSQDCIVWFSVSCICLLTGYSFLVIPLLVFLVLITNKLDRTVEMKYFAACAPLFLTFFTLMIASFGARGGKLPKKLATILASLSLGMINQYWMFSGNQYWFGLRKPPCQFLFGICPCLQLFGNISYSLYSNQGNSNR